MKKVVPVNNKIIARLGQNINIKRTERPKTVSQIDKFLSENCLKLGRYIKVRQIVCNNIIPSIQKQLAFLNKSVTVNLQKRKAYPLVLHDG